MGSMAAQTNMESSSNMHSPSVFNKVNYTEEYSEPNKFMQTRWPVHILTHSSILMCLRNTFPYSVLSV